ncbi:MAG TPA: transcriptional regulator [Firmicutes bacterium]|jgi:CarD family transcriptional regulator|nr:transcriptional regulator [Bacillota bacterium]
MAFKINDYVMYGATGACRITDIEVGDEGLGESTYYVLHPVFDDNLTIKIPARSRHLMRPIFSKEEVMQLIESLPEQEPYEMADERQQSQALKAAVKSGKNEELVRVIKTLYLEKQAKAEVNKTLNRAQEEIMSVAEKRLYEEFALALEITPEDVSAYIKNKLSHR